MVLRAIITCEACELRDWVDVASVRSDCRLPEVREARNPFTGKAQNIAPKFGEYLLFSGTESIGAIEPSPDFGSDRELHIYSPEPAPLALRAVASSIAEALTAKMEWIDDD